MACLGLRVYSVAGLGVISAVMQTLPAVDPPSLNSIKDLGTVGFLAIAVIFLWRGNKEDKAFFWQKLAEKDKDIKDKDTILMDSFKAMTTAVAANKSSADRVSDILDDIQSKLEHMDNVRDAIARSKPKE